MLIFPIVIRLVEFQGGYITVDTDAVKQMAIVKRFSG